MEKGRPEVAIDLDERVVLDSEGRRTSLTPLEVQVLAVLTAANGSPVARTTLERDVWGLAASVQSDAVPVAMRRLRKKVGTTLRTVRGFGWSLRLPVATPGVSRAPRPSHPWLDRPQLRGRLEHALAIGARLISVMGAPGIGKSRLVLETFPDAVWVTLVDTVHSAGRVLDAIARAVGTHTSEVEALRGVIRDRHPRVLVLDGGLALEPAAVSVCEVLAEVVPIVLACREAPPGAGWHVVPVPNLDAGQGQALYSLRAGGPPAWGIEEQLTRCDGIPASIELLAAQAWMGRPGPGLPGSDSLERAIFEGWSRLEPPLQHALAFLVGLGARFLREDPALDPEVRRAVPELVRRAFVQPGVDGGLRVLEPVRAVCRGRESAAPWVRRARLCLVERAEALASQVSPAPRASLDALESMVNSLDRVIYEAEPELAGRAALALCPLVNLRGPVTGHRRRIDTAMGMSLPDWLRERLAVERAFLIHTESPGSPDTLAGLEGIQTPRAHRVRGLFEEVHAKVDEALGHYERAIEAGGPSDASCTLLRARCAVLRHVHEGMPAADARADLLEVDELIQRSGRVAERPEIQRYRALLALREGARAEALGLAAAVLERVETEGLIRLAPDAWNTFAMCSMEDHLDQAEHAFERAGDAARQIGEVTTVFIVNQAFCLCCLDQATRVLELVQPVDVHPERVRPLVDLLCMAAFLRLGQGLDAHRTSIALDAEALGCMFSTVPDFGASLVALVGLLGPGAADAEAVMARCSTLAEDPGAGVMRGLLAYVRRVLGE